MDGQGQDARTVVALGSHVKTFSAMAHGALVSIVGGFSGFMDLGGGGLDYDDDDDEHAAIPPGGE